ncbi:MAG TPA: hypothetical protein VL404_02755 [Candidatus Eisenbacteria bacterium]|jgi:hypothetical protein|nr:hypothetical protein [Candidatus Eisenbacteria bacterium]
MDGRIKLLIGVLIAAVLAEAAWAAWLFWPRKRYTAITTTVRVTEGRVDVYRLDAGGKPVFLRAVNAGETVDVAGEERMRDDGGVLAFTGPVFPRIMKLFLREIEEMTRGGPPVFARLYTEEELNDKPARRIADRAELSALKLSIDAGGFTVTALVKHRFFDVTLIARGRIGLDRHERLFLELTEMRAGPVVLPRAVLRRLEDSFYRSVQAEAFPVRITKLEYRDKGIWIEGVRNEEA